MDGRNGRCEPARLAPVCRKYEEERAGWVEPQFGFEGRRRYGFDPYGNLEVVQHVRAPSTAVLIG